MEEILASIRKIISDDSEAEPAAEAAPLPADPSKDAQSMIEDMFEDEAPVDEGDIEAVATDDDDDTDDEAVLELTEDMVAEPIALVEGIDDEVDFGEAAPEEPAPAVAKPEPAPKAQAAAPKPKKPAAAPVDEKLISRETEAAVSSAFSSLAGMMLSDNARTLEDLVSDMLRPMLKSWLDDNLPGLVEEIVRSEIERVTRGGR